MDEQIHLELLDKNGIAWAQDIVTRYHYLRRPVDTRCSVEGYAVSLDGIQGPVGLFLLGRPEATRLLGFYGSLDDLQAGRVECSRWSVLNLARVWFDPRVQRDGDFFSSQYLPGFNDRKGQFRSTLVSQAIHGMIERVVVDYLVRRPPCFLNEPYQLRFLISYCDLSLHKGTIYAASGFEHYRTNDRGIQTWRIRLPALTADQDAAVRQASHISPRSNKYRAERAQLQLNF